MRKVKGSIVLKGEESREIDVISKPKNVCLSTETKTKKEEVSSFVINYHPSAIKLSISASGRNGLKLEKCRANVFQVLAFLFPKCVRTDHELFLSRIELISFLSLFLNYFVAT